MDLIILKTVNCRITSFKNEQAKRERERERDIKQREREREREREDSLHLKYEIIESPVLTM
jgi:hypothetical protein